MPFLTLLTDFGLEDGYVAEMKGVILGIAPDARMVDITHLVPPQDLAFARFRLLTVAPFFPAGTVHLAVVDPGVGTARRAVAIRSRSGSCFVGPDNGILLGALGADPPVAAVELSEPRYWRTPSPSATFHGRDVFSPVAAHLARGAVLESLGSTVALDELVALDLPQWQSIPGGAEGTVQAVDRFGNVVSNVPGALVSQRSGWTATIAGHIVRGQRTYVDSGPDQAIALVGSHGFVEIAVPGGDARRLFDVRVGDRVQVRWL